MVLTRLGLLFTNYGVAGTPPAELRERLFAAARAADHSAFDSLWVMDHFCQVSGSGSIQDPMPEAYTVLGALACITSRVRLGVLVTGVTYRNPALVAKCVTTIDLLSGGRAILGLGAAWSSEDHLRYGFPMPPPAERVERLDEAVAACRLMLTREVSDFQGEYYQLRGALNLPQPVQTSLPILVGGGGERRTLRVVAQHADAWNVIGSVPSIKRKLALLQALFVEAGRDFAALHKSSLSTLVLAPSQSEADRRASRLVSGSGMSNAELRGACLIGDEKSVRDQARERIAAGLDGLIVTLAGPPDPDAVVRAAEVLMEVLPDGGEARVTSSGAPCSPR